MWFFVFSINFARTREGRPARRKLTELLVKSKKTLVTEPAAIFFVFQVNISCKTTSIILYFKYASFSVVTRKKRQNTNPHPDGNFFDDRFGLGILRDGICKTLYCILDSNHNVLKLHSRKSSWIFALYYRSRSLPKWTFGCASFIGQIIIFLDQTTAYAEAMKNEGDRYNENVKFPFLQFIAYWNIQLTPENSNLQGKSKKVRVIGSSHYRGEN